MSETEKILEVSLSESLKYYELNTRCPFCSCHIIVPRIGPEKKEEYTYCPRCHKSIRILNGRTKNRESVPKIEFNPSERDGLIVMRS